MNLPDCYEADRQYEAMDRAYTDRLMRRPRCCKCGGHLASETCLDLSDFGLPDRFACQRCADAAVIDVSDLDVEG